MDGSQGLERAVISDAERQARQTDPNFIPGFIGAPEWAQWVQYCRSRGWIFTDKPPHVYADRHVSIHGVKWKLAVKVPTVEFLRNHKCYSGRSRPWDD
ncbi:hypothetical protein SmaMPs15_000067 [Stenotrophomonas maltophilia phage vB_SmaM_Ps15]|uniref:Uncharacterized protein n=1 Tax=Stenotrophomonas maltophilia phage vB_SmaM_Ps15 TaxID=3071007 RepID=A0AAE9FP59_9CAUD|nr:hypothetical protein PQC01_gp067 [Stenotrophomonas maltophilia phage vB_SmaM_Ps15]UMO77218.1 hypothetical protein SmaMPs15_000067 [Stenotrophomonas maltophilia phage vB_SmaM_Ps15]